MHVEHTCTHDNVYAAKIGSESLLYTLCTSVLLSVHVPSRMGMPSELFIHAMQTYERAHTNRMHVCSK